jgi:hypothetical protein
MGVIKGAAKHKAKKVVDNTLDDMGAVGDVIDKHTTTGPLDKAEDSVNKTKDDLEKKRKKREKEKKKDRD